MRVSGWGRFPSVDAEVVRAWSREHLRSAIARGPITPRGLGRSYGDSSLGDRIVDLTPLDHFVAFDRQQGVLTCEAGVSLSDILALVMPHGWFLPVTPGTRFVTVGGAVASDIHGKNHHKDGSFADHVVSMKVLIGSGEVLDTSPTEYTDLFRATCGGMGLTGVILEVTFRLLRMGSRNVDELVIRTPDLEATLDAFGSHVDSTYSVGWIDLVASGTALGRSLVMLGEHAGDGELSPYGSGTVARMPFDAPGFVISRATVAAFNAVYYRRIRGSTVRRTTGFEPFFYPLDAVADWNRVYGSRGFLQYQFVIPTTSGARALHEIVRRISTSGLASPLAVLKMLGEGNANYISFPMSGYTLAVDLQVGSQAFALCDALDSMVLDAGGRVYLTKDARMSAESFHASYSRTGEFQDVRRAYGAVGVFVSAQARRLGLE